MTDLTSLNLLIITILMVFGSLTLIWRAVSLKRPERPNAQQLYRAYGTLWKDYEEDTL